MSIAPPAAPGGESTAPRLPDIQGRVDISVVMPCLNEETSIGSCVDKAVEGIRRTGLRGEVVVCDNGSTDRSAEIAAAHGARVVHQAQRGYGNAYRTGFEAAQ